jgi:hypothetical protein
MSDVVNYIFPVKQFAADAVRNGTFPLWNPYVLAGYPFTYNTQAGLFYPLSLLYYTLPAATAVDATVILQMGLGGPFMYLYLRQLQLRRLAAVAGSVIFLFNGLMVVWLEWQVVHAAIIWLPLQLFFIERLALADRPHTALRYAVYAGIAFAIPWLGGHWNWTLYGSMTAAVYLLARLAGTKRQQWALYTAVVLGLGVALSLVQVLPALNYLRQSHREALPFDELLRFGLLNRAIVFFIPNFFGDPISQDWWGYDNYAETSLYLGILPLWLSLLALALRRDWHSWFFTLWGFLGLLWTLGTPVYGLLYALPVFNGLLPSRAAILVVFAGAVLAALALDSLLARGGGGRRTSLMVVPLLIFVPVTAAYTFYYRADVIRTWTYLRPYAALFLFWLLGSAALLLTYSPGRLSARAFGWLALLWLAADLITFGYRYNPTSSISALYPPTHTTNFLQTDPELFRIVTPPEGIAFPPNTTLVPRISSLSGYEPGILRRLVNYVNAAEGSEAIRFERKLQPLRAVDSPLLDALNVKYLVAIEERWGASEAAWAKSAVVEWQALSAEEPLERPFLMPEAGVHRVELPLRGACSNPVERDCSVTVRILSADGSYEFAHASLPTTELADETWQGFDFGAFPSEWGRAFRLRVEGEAEVGMTAAGEVAFVPYYLSRPGLVFEDGKTRVYLRDGYLSRAFVAERAVVVENEEAALTALRQHADELDEVVVVESELEGEERPLSVISNQLSVIGPQSSGGSDVVITRYGLNQVQLRVRMAEPGFVVLADSYYPGWRATVDGEHTPIYRADSVLRAVYVPAGQHEVMFVFRPLDFFIGATVSGLALAFAFIVILWTYRQERARVA